MASQHVLDSGRGRDSVLCACACQLWLLAARFNFELEIKYKAGKHLVLADALSRSFTSSSANVLALDLCNSLNLSQVKVDLTLDVLDFSL